MIMAAVGMGVSLLGAASNKKAAQRAMRAQAVADTASRQTTAKSMIASVHSQNAKVEELKRMDEMMQMQGKADAVIRKEDYNDMAATQLVMGAASGRVVSDAGGSIGKIIEKSENDFMWDQMWNANIQEISQAALYQDMKNIYQAGATSLVLGRNELEVARLGSMAGQTNTAAAAQQSFNNALVGGAKSVINNYGDSILGML